MRADAVHTDALTPAVRFAVLGLFWSLALFALVRLSWFDRHVVDWLIDVQRSIALWYGAPQNAAVVVDRTCSGTDVTALCLGVCLAYPAPWRLRLAGALGGTAIVLSLNTVRIGTLLASYPERALFDALHLYIWPMALMLAVAGYVFVWTLAMERRRSTPGVPNPRRKHLTRFGLAAVGLLTAYAAAAPWTMQSATVLAAGAWTATAGGAVLDSLGVASSAQGNLLITERGVFQVTQECLLTPVLPLYLAALVAMPLTRRTRWIAAAAAVPVFLALGVMRVLVLALPPALIASPVVVAHGFYQLAVGAAVVMAACVWHARTAPPRDRAHAPSLRFVIACAGALAFTLAVWSPWTAAVTALAHAGIAPHAAAAWAIPGDVQGALPLLPPFQLGLLTALTIALAPRTSARATIAALAVLGVSQAGVLIAIGEASAHGDLTVHPLAIRAWAVSVPIALWWLFLPRRGADAANGASKRAYRSTWEQVGEQFPDLHGAASTSLYFANEVRLWTDHMPPLEGRLVLKSDLWDEAKNTRILQWAADRGARVHGIDISGPIVRQARQAFGARRLDASVADIRWLPFGDDSFDAIYSMGTIEHFDDSEAAVLEMARVLKPGGRLVLGVPNRHDPFLRPLLVVVMRRLRIYGYGFEKSYSRRALRALVKRAGLDVVAETGILFVPGWLRMLDLLAHTRGWRGVTRITASAVDAFGALERRWPQLRRHGYLIAAVGVKPDRPRES